LIACSAPRRLVEDADAQIQQNMVTNALFYPGSLLSFRHAQTTYRRHHDRRVARLWPSTRGSRASKL
jgi:hypothetical protein